MGGEITDRIDKAVTVVSYGCQRVSFFLRLSNSLPRLSMYFSARNIVSLASWIFSWIFPVWIIDQERFAVERARFMVVSWYTARIGVSAALIAPEPS